MLRWAGQLELPIREERLLHLGLDGQDDCQILLRDVSLIESCLQMAIRELVKNCLNLWDIQM